MQASKDRIYSAVARLLANSSTCVRRTVGCVLTDSDGQVLATGYNGVASKQPHCNLYDEYHPTGFPHACRGAFAKSGTDLHLCEAIHAEQNALLQCSDVRKIHSCYVTTSPCIHCVKLLMNTGCKHIVADALYDEEAMHLWTNSDSNRTIHITGHVE